MEASTTLEQLNSIKRTEEGYTTMLLVTVTLIMMPLPRPSPLVLMGEQLKGVFNKAGG